MHLMMQGFCGKSIFFFYFGSKGVYYSTTQSNSNSELIFLKESLFSKRHSETAMQLFDLLILFFKF